MISEQEETDLYCSFRMATDEKGSDNTTANVSSIKIDQISNLISYLF